MNVRKLQITRRLVQIGVLLLILLVPVAARYANYLSAFELDENLEKWQGSLQGEVLQSVDDGFRALPRAEQERVGRMDRDRKQILSYTQLLHGSPWSMELGSLSLTDPLAGAESISASKRIKKVLLIGLIIPVLAAVLLGRVFCSWICPMHLLLEMTDKLRGLLRFLEIKPRDVKFDRSVKYVLLAVGLVMTAFLARPVLGYIYPPAIIGREAHDFVFALFDRAEDGKFGLWWGGLTWMSLIILGIVLFELTVSRRWWCRYVCPGGALYSLLGSRRPIRIKLDPVACTRCADCVTVCPIGLNPMNDEMGKECDNCGLCLSHCGDDALSYSVASPVRLRKPAHAARATLLPLVIVISFLGSSAAAHHILGIPHYSYDEDYPQTPVLTYKAEAGAYDVKMTGYPGKPAPGDRCSIYIYVNHRDTGAVFEKALTFTALEKRWLGKDEVVYGPMPAELDQAVFKFYPQFDAESEYMLRVEFEAEGEPWIIELPMVVGEPGSPIFVLGGVASGVVLFLVIIRAIRIKRQRSVKRAAQAKPVPA
ncbi:MAG: 4Fe-4S binding protein [Verrucomicrobia bacterium]|nr:4Fe-4S binding protein [Verrucomicrobiota bacterium]MDA1086557.1 4Fe-4S binding protein [Verrucomicrobiota bacterium]